MCDWAPSRFDAYAIFEPFVFSSRMTTMPDGPLVLVN